MDINVGMLPGVDLFELPCSWKLRSTFCVLVGHAGAFESWGPAGPVGRGWGWFGCAGWEPVVIDEPLAQEAGPDAERRDGAAESAAVGAVVENLQLGGDVMAG